MNPKSRSVIIIIGGIFSAGLVHSLLPQWDIWLRAALTAATALIIASTLALTLPHPPKP